MVLRVLHLPHSVAGNAWGLSQGERSLGLDSRVLAQGSGYAYPTDFSLELSRHPLKKYGKLIYSFLKLRNAYDVFHFNSGSSLIHSEGRPWMHHLELPYYPKNARLFVTYNGCDARQKYPTMLRCAVAACHNSSCYGGVCESGDRDRWRQQAIRKMDRYVEHFWALNPDLLHFLPKGRSSFLPYTVAHYHESPAPVVQREKLRIVHAPTDRAAKGTGAILAALKELERIHPDKFELRLIEGLTHRQALKEYRQADLLIDQVMIGWYGAVAVEAMLLGKPVLARIALEDLQFVPQQMADELLGAVINAGPQDLVEHLERCILDRVFLKQRSEACLAYARRWHHPDYVAALTTEEYQCQS